MKYSLLLVQTFQFHLLKYHPWLWPGRQHLRLLWSCLQGAGLWKTGKKKYYPKKLWCVFCIIYSGAGLWKTGEKQNNPQKTSMCIVCNLFRFRLRLSLVRAWRRVPEWKSISCRSMSRQLLKLVTPETICFGFSKKIILLSLKGSIMMKRAASCLWTKIFNTYSRFGLIIDTFSARYTTTTFISALGGALGAWMGFSVCMIFEVA